MPSTYSASQKNWTQHSWIEASRCRQLAELLLPHISLESSLSDSANLTTSTSRAHNPGINSAGFANVLVRTRVITRLVLSSVEHCFRTTFLRFACWQADVWPRKLRNARHNARAPLNDRAKVKF